MKINHFRSLLAALTFAMVFTYSCSSTEEEKKYYAAKIARANSADTLFPLLATMESYTFLYPYISMGSKGYFLNEKVKSEFVADMCSYYLNNMTPNERNSYGLDASGSGFNTAIDCCEAGSIQDLFRGEMAEMKDWLKSENIPFYNDIVSEIFVEGNSKFLGFYKVNGQEHYIFVWGN